jgi:hypothetical protein
MRTGTILSLLSRLLKKYFKWFDKLTTNDQMPIISMSPPFVIPAKAGIQRFLEKSLDSGSSPE